METPGRKILGVKLTRWRIILLSLALLSLLLTVALRGEVAPQTIQVVDGQKYLAPPYGEDQFAMIGYSDDFKNWTLDNSTSSYASLNNSIVLLQGTFGPSSNLSSAAISKTLAVNLSQYPILYLRINVPAGLRYGIHLYAEAPNGSSLVFKDVPGLAHLSGSGSFQNVQVNTLFGTQGFEGNLTRISVYVERGPAPTPTSFSLEIRSLQFLDYPLTPINSSPAPYHSAYLSFDSMPFGNQSWPLDHITLGATINASAGATYTIFLLDGQKIYQVGTYEYSPTTAYYEYTLVPLAQSASFPDALPSSGNVSIVVVMTSGYLEHFDIDYVRFIFLPKPDASSSLSFPAQLGRLLYTYVSFFLFLLPLWAALLLYYRYRQGALRPSHVTLVLIVGIVSRLALAPITSHPYDTQVFATSERAWFQFGIPNASLGPTLPFTFFLYRLPYSFYAVLQMLGFHDLHFVGHQIGMLESVFTKGFPMISDFVVFYFLLAIDRSNKMATVLASFYLLNPLSIYVSSVWGQYEAAATALIIIGFWLLVTKTATATNKKRAVEFVSSLALTLSALVELVALIPLAYLVVRSFFARPFRPIILVLMLSPLLLFLVYPPEFHMAYLVFASALGAIPVLGFSAPNIYSLAATLPGIAYFHPLLASLFLVTVAFIVLGKRDLGTTSLFATGAFLCIILFGAQLVQWWDLIPPLAILAALLTKKYALGIYTLVFGAMVAFVAFSYTQDSGYMILGNQSVFLMPIVEGVRNGLQLYTVTTTIGALLLVAYMFRGASTGDHTLRNSSIFLVSVFLVEYVVFGLFGF